MPNKKRGALSVLLDNGLTLSQRAVFAIMVERGREQGRRNPLPITIGHLAQLLGQTRNSAAAHLNALCEAGYITRDSQKPPMSDLWRVAA